MTDSTPTAQQEIFEICEAIFRAGGWPTQSMVRERRGGSDGTTAKYLKLWKEMHQERQRQESAQRLPELPAEVAAHMSALWPLAVAAAKAEFAQEKAQLTSELEQTQEERGKALRDLAVSEERVSEALESLGKSEARSGVLTGQVHDLELTKSTLLQRLSEQDKELLAGQDALAQARLEREQEAARTELRIAKIEEAGQERENLAYERLEGARQQLMAETAQQRQEAAHSVVRIEEAFAAYRKESEQRAEQLRLKAMVAERELAKVQEQARAAHAEVDRLQVSNRALESRMDALVLALTNPASPALWQGPLQDWLAQQLADQNDWAVFDLMAALSEEDGDWLAMLKGVDRRYAIETVAAALGLVQEHDRIRRADDGAGH